MSQRNPMNERYSPNADRDGKTRKSASSAKPKRKASEGVRVKQTTKTKEQKRKEATARRKEDRTRVQSSGGPKTPEYKKWRKVWWTLMVITIVLTFFYMILASNASVNKIIPTTALVAAYGTLIAAVVIEFKCCRPIRKEFERKIANMTVAQKRKYDQEVAIEQAEKRAATTGWYGFVNKLAKVMGKDKGKADEVGEMVEKEKAKADEDSSEGNASKGSAANTPKTGKAARKAANKKAYTKKAADSEDKPDKADDSDNTDDSADDASGKD